MIASPQTATPILKAQLITQLDRLVNYFFTARHIQKSGHEYRIGRNGSLSIRRCDGAFSNFETGEAGDVIVLVQSALKTNFNGALAFARSFVGGNSLPAIPATPDNNRRKKDDTRILQQRHKALAMLKRSKPIKNTLAEHYLREYRGISTELPNDIRFIEHAYNYTASGYFPAMCSTIRDVKGEAIAAHITFLDPATSNKITGNNVKSRLIFGSCKGGAIQLARPTQTLALVEGIEDALSIMQGCPDTPVWATGGTSGLISVDIPEEVREVMLCGDRDKAGINAVNKKAALLARQHKIVKTVFPPEGVKDFNELLMRGEQ